MFNNQTPLILLMNTLPNSTAAPFTVQGGGASTSTRKFILTDLLAATAKPLPTQHISNPVTAQTEQDPFHTGSPGLSLCGLLFIDPATVTVASEKRAASSAIVVDIGQYRHATHLHIQRCRGFRRHHYWRETGCRIAIFLCAGITKMT